MKQFTTKFVCTVCAALFAGGLVQASDQVFTNPSDRTSIAPRNNSINIAGQYLGRLNVTVDDFDSPETNESVTIETNDELTTATFILKNFVLQAGESPDDILPVGNIRIPEIPIEVEDGMIKLVSNLEITIEAGDDPGYFWAGPLLGDIPIELDTTIDGDHMDVSINIILGAGDGQQVIEVHFEGDKECPDAVTQIEDRINEAYVYRIDGNSIGISGIEEGSFYRIYSHTGALVMHGHLRSTTINTERLMQGIYILRVGNHILKFVH